MEFFKDEEAVSGAFVLSTARASAADSSRPERLAVLLDAIAEPASVAMLIGDAGSGKTRLALEAAHSLAEHVGEKVTVISLSPPPNPMAGMPAHFGYHFPALLGASDALDNREHLVLDGVEAMGERLLEAVQRAADGGVPVIVAPGVDRYAPVAAAMLERLVRSRSCRVIATAQRMSGLVAQLVRDPRVHKITVPPFTLEESRRFLSQLLGTEYVEAQTLRRWYRVTEGNSLSLTLFALTLDRRGLVGRQRGVAYELPGAVLVPAEFHEFLRETCTEAELRTLEVIAYAEPVFETELVRRLDPEHVAALRDRGLVSLEASVHGPSALSLRHQLLAAAVRERMSADRVLEVSRELFDALLRGTAPGEPWRSPRLLFRLVAFGLDSDREVPFEWLWDALEILRSGHEYELRLRIALAVAEHQHASAVQFAAAAAEAAQLARLLGDKPRLMRALGLARAAAERITQFAPVASSGQNTPAALLLRLVEALIDHRLLDFEDDAGAFELLEQLERDCAVAVEREREDGTGVAPVASLGEQLRALRVRTLGGVGRLREAAELAPGPREFGSMPEEWERGASRAVLSLVLCQQGEFEAGIRLAEQTESVLLMDEFAQAETIEVLRFCAFVNYWGCGLVESARDRLKEWSRSTLEEHFYSGLIDACAMLLSLSDGKWRLAVQRGERLVARLGTHDRFGLSGLAQAGLALAFAALGETAASRRAMRVAETRQYGLSQMTAGYLRLLTLRARQWIRDPQLNALCLRLASWARDEHLPSIELHALHLFATLDGSAAAVYRGRIQALAEQVEPPLSSVMLEHCDEIFAGQVAWESPASRRLAEFGIWTPLPPTEELSAREREIALFAALGYSSRWIAEQFHLSVRTVDTHLRHVFTKLGLGGRDELRSWFRRDHDRG